MKPIREDQSVEETFWLAGQRVQPGRYQNVSTGRIVELPKQDTLPASLDGCVACYVRLSHAWEQIRLRYSRNRKGKENRTHLKRRQG